jgi:hypothetical protein
MLTFNSHIIILVCSNARLDPIFCRLGQSEANVCTMRIETRAFMNLLELFITAPQF